MTSTTFFFVFIPILAIILLGVNLIFAPHNPYQEKDSAFECGFHSFLGQNRTQFSISFFIFALLFLLFDLEILLVYPYVVSAYTNGIYGLVIMLIFFLALTLGFAFELGKNALKIDSRQMLSFISNNNNVIVLIGKFKPLMILDTVNEIILTIFNALRSITISDILNSLLFRVLALTFCFIISTYSNVSVENLQFAYFIGTFFLFLYIIYRNRVKLIKFYFSKNKNYYILLIKFFNILTKTIALFILSFGIYYIIIALFFDYNNIINIISGLLTTEYLLNMDPGGSAGSSGGSGGPAPSSGPGGSGVSGWSTGPGGGPGGPGEPDRPRSMPSANKPGTSMADLESDSGASDTSSDSGESSDDSPPYQKVIINPQLKRRLILKLEEQIVCNEKTLAMPIKDRPFMEYMTSGHLYSAAALNRDERSLLYHIVKEHQNKPDAKFYIDKFCIDGHDRWSSNLPKFKAVATRNSWVAGTEPRCSGVASCANSDIIDLIKSTTSYWTKKQPLYRY